jgi:hypothetical protein
MYVSLQCLLRLTDEKHGNVCEDTDVEPDNDDLDNVNRNTADTLGKRHLILRLINNYLHHNATHTVSGNLIHTICA